MANSSKRSRLSAVALGAIVLSCLCGVGGVGVVLKIVTGRAGGLPTAYEEARSAGLAISINDLRRKVDPKEDALPAVLRAADEFAKVPDIEEMQRLGYTVLSFEANERQKRRLRDAMQESAPALEALREAGQYAKMSVLEPEIRFDPRPFPPGDVLNFGALLFAAEALMAGERGDLPRARQALSQGRALLPLMESEKTYPSFNNRAWAEINLQRALVRIVQENIDRPESVELLRDFQTQIGPLPSVRSALAGDLALSLDAISRRKEEEVEQLPLADAFKDMGRADIVGIFRRAVQRMPDDPEGLAEIDAALNKMEDEAEEAPIYGGYAKGYRSILLSLKDIVTRRRLAKTVLAILDELHRGEIPSQVPDLGKDSIDPHSGKPFRIRRTANRLIVYSLGRDNLDDEGRERPPLRLGLQTRDVVFGIPLSPNQRAR